MVSVLPRDIGGAAKLFKLHGCVSRQEYITTLNAIASRETYEQSGFLERAFSDRPCLVVGYSGLGDTDLFPHLRKASISGANFVWVDRQDVGCAPIDGAWYWAGNLHTNEKNATPPNSLLALAPDTPSIDPAPPHWPHKLADWMRRLSREELHGIVLGTCRDYSGMPILRYVWAKQAVPERPNEGKYANTHTLGNILNVGGRSNSPMTSLPELALAYIGVSDYYGVRLNMPSRVAYDGCSPKEMVYYGFVDWRSGKLLSALNWFRGFVADSYNDPRWQAVGVRLYLEVILDLVRGRGLSVIEKQEQACVRRALDMLLKFSQPTISDDMMSEIIFVQISHEIGECQEDAISRLEQIIERAKNLILKGVAEAAMRALITIDMPRGVKHLDSLGKRPGRNLNKNARRKSLAAELYAIYKQVWIFYLVDGPRSPTFRAGVIATFFINAIRRRLFLFRLLCLR